MNMMNVTRRRFLNRVSAGAGLLAAGNELGFLRGLGTVSAEDARLDPGLVRLRPEIEPIVRLLEETPRERLLEEVGGRIRAGRLSYQEVLAALLLAGVKNIQPRPVGFKFHAVLVVNSAHIASLASPDADRWLPIFWALDYFKNSQAQDVQQGDWTMAAVEEARVPAAHLARTAFVDAMENWDVAAADAAVAGAARTLSAHDLFELFARFGSRDFRDIGHKAIYVANGWRTLECIGWQHAEPVLRSLAYALLEHEGDNPAHRDGIADRPWRENVERSARIRGDWLDGAMDAARADEMLPVLRGGTFSDSAEKAVELVNAGVHPDALWDTLFGFAGELMMRRADILSLHAVTASNAMFHAYRMVKSDDTRRMLLLQNASFLTMFRRDPEEIADRPQRIDGLVAAEGLPQVEGEALEAIFAEISRDRGAAASKVLAFCEGDPLRARSFMDSARRYLFLKGDNTHDYKYTAAVLEDYHALSPAIRDRFLAASVYNLRGSGDADNALVARIRAALA